MINYKRLFWVLTAAATALRLSIIGRLGITIDEAHYALYAKYLDLSYFDHPPLIGYILKPFIMLFGTTEFAVRLPAVILFVLTSWLFYACVKKLYDERTAFFSIVLLNVLPVFSFLGAVITVTDSPLAFFWVLTFYIFLNILETQNKNLWYLLGLSIGFAALAKYNAVMLPAGVFLFLFFYKPESGKSWVFRIEPYLAMLIAFLCFTPVIIWNIQNNWASMGFQLNRGIADNFEISLLLFGRSLGAQAGYVSPLLFIVYVYAAYKCFKDAFIKRDSVALAIACFSLPVLIFFNAVAIFKEILPHWPAMGYLILTPYVTHLILKYWQVKWFRRYIYTGAALALVMMIILPLHAMYKIVPLEKFMPAEIAQKEKYGIPEAERVDLTNELYGWGEVSDEIHKLVKANTLETGQTPFVFTHKSYLAGQIAFYLPDIRVYCFDKRISAYDFWQRDISALNGKDAIFVMNDYFHTSPEKLYPFQSFDKAIELPIYRNGKVVRKFWFVVCKKFDLSALNPEYTKNIAEKAPLKETLIKYDNAAFNFINRKMHNRVLNFIMAPISYCDAYSVNITFIIMALACIIVLRIERPKTFWLDLALLVAILITGGLLTSLLKNFFIRPRPLTFFGEENVNFFYEQVHRNSFPSGHTQIVFAAATFMAYKIQRWRWAFFLWAVFTAFERVYVGSHFPADTITGAVIGILIATVMVKLFNPKTKQL